MNYVRYLSKMFLRRAENKGRGPEVGLCFTCSRNRVSVARADSKENSRRKNEQATGSSTELIDFTVNEMGKNWRILSRGLLGSDWGIV